MITITAIVEESKEDIGFKSSHLSSVSFRTSGKYTSIILKFIQDLKKLFASRILISSSVEEPKVADVDLGLRLERIFQSSDRPRKI